MHYHINLKDTPSLQEKSILKSLIKEYLIPQSDRDVLSANTVYPLEGNEVSLTHDICKNGSAEFLILNGKVREGEEGKYFHSNHAMTFRKDELCVVPKKNVLEVLYDHSLPTKSLIKTKADYYSILSGHSATLVNLQGSSKFTTSFGFFMPKEQGKSLVKLLKNTDALEALTFATKMELAMSLLNDLENLHDKGFTHNYLNERHIVYDETRQRLKITYAGAMQRSMEEHLIKNDVLRAKDVIELLFTTNSTRPFNPISYGMEEPASRRAAPSNAIEKKLNTIFETEYNKASELKEALKTIADMHIKAPKSCWAQIL